MLRKRTGNAKEGRSRLQIRCGIVVSDSVGPNSSFMSHISHWPLWSLGAAHIVLRSSQEMSRADCTRGCEIFHTFSLISCVSLPPPRTSTSCATGQRWSTWEALTTMQHNHSHRAAPPTGPTSQERAKCPISATIHSLDSLSKRGPALLSDPPSSYRRGEGAEGSGGAKKEKRKRDTRAFCPGNWLQTNRRDRRWHIRWHTRDFALKMRWKQAGNKTATLTNMTTVVQTRRRRAAAPPLCSVPAKPPRLSKATGSTKRASSLFLC